ncbi:hypothetical protein [Coleofasciculus sp.]
MVSARSSGNILSYPLCSLAFFWSDAEGAIAGALDGLKSKHYPD